METTHERFDNDVLRFSIHTDFAEIVRHITLDQTDADELGTNEVMMIALALTETGTEALAGLDLNHLTSCTSCAEELQ